MERDIYCTDMTGMMMKSHFNDVTYFYWPELQVQQVFLKISLSEDSQTIILELLA